MKSRRFVKVGFVLVLSIFSTLNTFTAQTAVYSVVDLGTLPGGNQSIARGLNNLGDVAGFGNTAADFGVDFAFVWSSSIGMVSLGPVLGNRPSWAVGINDLRQVVGGSSQGPLPAAFVWESTSGFQYLGTLPGGDGSFAVGINNLGQVVGHANTATTTDRAFFWDSAVGMLNLGILDSSHTVSWAAAINDFGQVAGFSGVPEQWTSFLWEPSTGLSALGNMAGFLSQRANGINNFGQVVGWASPTGGEHSPRAFLWSQSGGFVNLGTLPGGDDSRAFAINGSGLVVGSSTTAVGVSDYRAVVWRASAIRDLNDLIPSDSGWVLRSAEAINDFGQIVGTGVFRNQTRAFLLDPIADTTPPVISGLPAFGCSIWPPNNKLVQVAMVTAADAESGIAPGSFNVIGTSTDPVNGQIVITGGPSRFDIKLRADKGQIYTLTATASDLAGNTTTKQATCTVSHR